MKHREDTAGQLQSHWTREAAGRMAVHKLSNSAGCGRVLQCPKPEGLQCTVQFAFLHFYTHLGNLH